ncbi:MAG: hypothetical protein AAB612_01545 [Patescibacteria group bacterium]|mgnify:FL=1
MMFTLLAQTSTFFGTIEPPPALEPYGENGGLVMFGSNALKFAVIVGGLIALFNVVMAGYIYLTSAGDAKAHEKVMGKLTSSLWGLSLMVLAPAIMAIMGFLLFKNSTYFLSPQLVGPGTTNGTEGGSGTPKI